MSGYDYSEDAYNRLDGIEDTVVAINSKLQELSDIYAGVQTFNALVQMNAVLSNYIVRYSNGKYYAQGFSVHECICPIEMYNWLVDRKRNEHI